LGCTHCRTWSATTSTRSNLQQRETSLLTTYWSESNLQHESGPLRNPPHDAVPDHGCRKAWARDHLGQQTDTPTQHALLVNLSILCSRRAADRPTFAPVPGQTLRILCPRVVMQHVASRNERIRGITTRGQRIGYAGDAPDTRRIRRYPAGAARFEKHHASTELVREEQRQKEPA